MNNLELLRLDLGAASTSGVLIGESVEFSRGECFDA